MNKKRIDRMLPDAAAVLKETRIAKDGKIDKTFRGQISSFGSAVSTGSLLAAVAYFSKQNNAKVKRDDLMDAIFRLIRKEVGRNDPERPSGTLYTLIRKEFEAGKPKLLFDIVRNAGPEKQQEMKELVLDCAVALKLAMNLFELEEDDS